MNAGVFPKALTVAVVLACGAPGPIQADPKIKLEPKHIDLGVIEEGSRFERFVEVTNVGDGVLVITDVKTSCGCTAATVDGVVELSANESQKIRVTFDSKNMDGHVKKNVVISSTDPVLPKVSVPLEADVHMPVKWSPKYVTLARIGPKMPFEQVVELQSDVTLDLQVKDQYILGGTLRSAPSRIFDLETRPARQDGDRRIHEFVVRLQEGVKPQKISQTLCVVTNLEAPRDTLRVPIRGEILGRITVTPAFAVLPMVNSGEETARDLTFTASDGTFNVIRAEVADSPVTAEVYPSEGGRQTVIRLRYTGEEKGINGVRTLTVETDDPEQRLIEVPVRYQTREPSPEAEHRATADVRKSQGPN